MCDTMVGMQIPAFDRTSFSPGMQRRLAQADDGLHLYTIHGSHLYGLAHANSDTDRFIVADMSYPRPLQEVRGEEDIQVFPMRHFLHMIHEGNPVALEALWSPEAQMSPVMAELSRSFRVGSGRAQHAFRSFIDMFIGDSGIEKMKNRRHVLRIAMQLRQVMEEGRFNPVLPPQAVHLLTRIATRYEGDDFLPIVDAWFDWASDVTSPVGQRTRR